MNKKIFSLLIGWMLVASTAGLYAQTVFVDQDEDVVTVPVSDDTVAAQTTEPPQIQVLERTWGLNLEQYLKDKIVELSKQPIKKVDQQVLLYVYKVYQVPCIGSQTVYISMSADREFYLSKQDPTASAEFYTSQLEFVVSPSRHQTDDEVFGTPVSNGDSRKLKILEFGIKAPLHGAFLLIKKYDNILK